MNNIYKKLGVQIPEILLPAEGTDLTKWAVIACDQYTSQPDYWQHVEEEVGDSPSALKLILPEIYLKEADIDKRINSINHTMGQYLSRGILQPQKPGFILVERSTPHTASRKGLILAIDLECYDYSAGSQALIRATEGTVLERIPPRVKIRENAPIELPHIMVLIDDPNKTVIESLYAKKDNYEKLYEFDLMMNGGHIRGWKIEDTESLAQTASALEKLVGDGSSMNNKPMLFAVGDGNHSLASAKAHWENVKASLRMKNQSPDAKPAEAPDCVPEHPARYALVEVVNVHDDGLAFEPIHRVIFGIESSNVCERLINAAHRIQLNASWRMFESVEAFNASIAAVRDMKTTKGGKVVHHLPFIFEGIYGLLTVENPLTSLEAGTLQSILDELLKDSNETGNEMNKDMEIDYIHGEKAVIELCSKPGRMGFFLPVMSKHDLFRTVKSDGVLPRKTFSMGEAEEKRYYLECRRISQI